MGETGEEVAGAGRSRGHVAESGFYSRPLEDLWTFQAGRCHELISLFLFKIVPGPVWRTGWTGEETVIWRSMT